MKTTTFGTLLSLLLSAAGDLPSAASIGDDPMECGFRRNLRVQLHE